MFSKGTKDHEHLDNNTPNYQSKMTFVFVLTLFFFFIEILGGIISNSLALLADAGHMLQDVLALGLAMFVLQLAKRPGNSDHSYGFKRGEVLAAFTNGLFLIIISMYLLFEAFNRIDQPEKINSELMFIVSMIGLVVNIIGVLILFQSSSENLNVKAVFLHGLSDALGSIGALLASLLIFFTGNPIFDVLVTFLITILITASGINLLKKTIHILMEGTPEEFDVSEIKSDILTIDGIINVHDFHIWSLSSNEFCFSGHAVIKSSVASCDIIELVSQLLNEKYGIKHSTVQIEHKSYLEKCKSCE